MRRSGLIRHPPGSLPAIPIALLAVGCGYRGHVVGELTAGEGGGAASAGIAGGGVGGSGAAATAARFMLGADLSWVQEQEDNGARFTEPGGAPEDILAILKRHGMNYVRLRLFNDPSSPCRTSAMGDETCGYQFELAARAEPYCDLSHTIEMARRVKAAGLGFMIDFHYSDTWADPDDQNKPLAWEALSFEALAAALEAFTRDSLTAFAAAGAAPDMVQLGNEITAGMLFPDGLSSAPGSFTDFAALVKAAIAGARAAAPSTPILLHIEKPDDLVTSSWWLDNAFANDIEFDVLGQSCYPEWHGTSADWAPTFEALASRYPDLRFIIAEYSQEKRAVNDILFALPDGRGLGSFIWEPTQWGETLFDRQGQDLVANELLSVYDQMAEDYGLR